MSEQPPLENELQSLAIEGALPLKAVGIENLRESHPAHMPPHRYLHPWFARRPTPASRLAILASILPKGTSSDELLRWMQIGPREGTSGGIENYVENKKATEDERDGTLSDHYGYPRSFTRSPSEVELQELHETLEKEWGELPTILDPTSGGGVIPFESIRYGLPTKTNELNPVPALILKTLLHFAPEVGSLASDVRDWANKIHDEARKNLSEFFPNSNSTRDPDSYACTYLIECPTCGFDVPLVPKWRVRSYDSGKNVIAKPRFDQEGNVSYDCLHDPSEEELGDFDPLNGPVSRGGDVECLNCGVVTEHENVKSTIDDGAFEYDIYTVKYVDSNGDYGYRAPTKEDLKALERAEQKVQNDYELSTILSEPIPDGQKTAEPKLYGMNQWRDLYTPRQLLSLCEYCSVTKELEPQIREAHTDEEADAILSLLTFVAGNMADYNCRLGSWNMRRGCPDHVFRGNHFGFKRVFADNNLSVGSMAYLSHLDKILSGYEEVASYVDTGAGNAELTNQDAADLPYGDESIQSVVIDPPYYDSVMYAELSDFFYVWMKEYLGDVFPTIFGEELTNKDNEAVANPGKYRELSTKESSQKELAREEYEQKMGDIFSELYRVLESGGVMTVMFTHKETDAWDTLTTSLIDAGFIITSTHPITSEMPTRDKMRENASADSTLLLTGRKPTNTDSDSGDLPSLWSDVREDTRKAAKEAARDLLSQSLTLTKTDVIISAFGPTLRVFANSYPVVDDEDNKVPPRRALEEAREAVTQVLVDEYLDADGIEEIDDVSEWYVLCWLVHEAQTFSYDEGRQLGLGIGVDIDDIKRSTKTWRKSSGEIKLRGHTDRVQSINEKPENRSSRTPVNPDDLSFGLALDKVHAAMHVYDVQGESAACDWLRDRNFDSDSTFKATLKALLQVLPHDHEDWELARDLAVGRTRDVLDLDFSPNVFAENSEQTQQTGIDDY
jgi:adenine-specific DNA methylase